MANEGGSFKRSLNGKDAEDWEAVEEHPSLGHDGIESGRHIGGSGNLLKSYGKEPESWEEQWPEDEAGGCFHSSTNPLTFIATCNFPAIQNGDSSLQETQQLGASCCLSLATTTPSLGSSGVDASAAGVDLTSNTQKLTVTSSNHHGLGTLAMGSLREESRPKEASCSPSSAVNSKDPCLEVCGLGPGAPAVSGDAKSDGSWVCAICHNVIPLAETARVKGCDHHYCANCILQWCSYKTYPWCPQCRTPFNSLLLLKLLDGSLSDEWTEESVCLLLRAPWYSPVEVVEVAELEEDVPFDDEYDEDDYFRNTVRLGNRRWGENGYVRGGRMQARVTTARSPGTPSPSSQRGTSSRAGGTPGTGAKSNTPGKGGMGRRAKRAQKREEADRGEASTASQPARHQGHRQPQQQSTSVS